LSETVYRYTKSGKWIQISINVVNVIYCSAGGAMEICATWQLPKFLFQGSDE